MTSLLLEDPRVSGLRVRIESCESLEGTLYYLEQTEEIVQNFEANSRASTIGDRVICGDAVLVVRGRKGAFLYNLLTYPLVKEYGKIKGVPLSSDAFTQCVLICCLLRSVPS